MICQAVLVGIQTHRSVRGRVAKRASAARLERGRRGLIVDGALRLEEARVVLVALLVGAGMRASGEREQAARDEHERDDGGRSHGCAGSVLISRRISCRRCLCKTIQI